MSAYEARASWFFRAAGITPTEDEMSALTKDLRDLAKDELDAFDPTNVVPHEDSARDAASILLERIGGLKNLQSYVNCLTVKTK